ncbi:Copper transport outer membrane protein, MctB [Brevibacterium sp. 239c]|uniref:copper transporter n=1 Tax=Brevibacterium sp. 239c TaxID=1965356 RepID=UPI000C47FBC9|nr:copper transporter [Brevibacterium sp. 239c]SMY03961.1 Copper transport outer membrane protein, MctB [Brevibacterium sp. 239c]
MIDFRYHLVSLVSVFLALAVGIVLGAGPLKEPIGESLQSQVDALRADRDDLRAKIDAANGNIDKQNDFVTSAAPELIGDTLKGKDVSIIGAPKADPEQVEEVTNRIKEAGGKIGGDVSFVDNTLSLTDSADFLSTLRDLVPDLPKDDSTALRSALVIALTGNASMLEKGKDRDVAEKKSSALFDAFVDAGRLRTDTDHKPTPLFVVVDDENSKLADETEPSPDATDDKANRTLITDFINSLTSDSKSVVVAGDAGSAQNGLVSILRTEKSRASTVDGLGLGAGAVITVRALAAGVAGTHGHYGFSKDAEQIMPGKD